MSEIDIERLGRQVAAHVLDALNAAKFGELLADRVVGRINVGPDSAQGWARDYIHPPWSGHCLEGQHDECNGTAPPSERGCQCPHHSGEPWPEHGYRLRLVELTEAEYHAEGGGRP